MQFFEEFFAGAQLFFNSVEKVVFEVLELFAFTGDLPLDPLFLGNEFFEFAIKGVPLLFYHGTGKDFEFLKRQLLRIHGPFGFQRRDDRGDFALDIVRFKVPVAGFDVPFQRFEIHRDILCVNAF